MLPKCVAYRAVLVPLIVMSGVVSGSEQVVDPSRFEVTVLASGLTQPMELAVAPDGTVYFIELAGRLRSIDPQTRAVSLVGELTVTTEQENGLLGLALDPDFARTGWVYLQYSPPDFPGQHISRFSIINGQLDPNSEKLLLKFEEQRKECCHHAGSLQFGPHGDLFIATGDNTHPHGDSQGYAPIDERPDRMPWDAQKSSANTNSYNGKILRIHPRPDGGYDIPDGNLLPKDGSGGRPEIYAMGCRNPWRMSVDRKTGFVYWGEVGPDAGADGERGPKGYDEINQAREAGNFGWPYFIADNQAYADVNFATGVAGARFDLRAPLNDSPNNTGASVLPPPTPALIYYPYGVSAEFPELGEGGRSACAGPVYYFEESLGSAVKFPVEYDHCLLIYEWSRHWIRLVHLDESDRVRRIEPFLPDHRFVRPVDLEFGPEGSLYVMEYGETWGVNPDARLSRIDYVRGNRAPIAIASAENNIGRQPLTVSLSSEGSYDKDPEDSLSREWRLIDTQRPAAAPVVLSHEISPDVTIREPGIYNVELVVTDAQGASRAAAVPVIVGNERAQIRFERPRSGDFFDGEHTLRYEVVVNDPEDGTNDDHELQENGAGEFDPDAPRRISVNAEFVKGTIPKGDGGTPSTDQGPAGMKRMKGSDCFNCHAVDQKRVGPTLLDIASKYRGRDGALEASVQRVMKGSSGVWGTVPMIPHSHHTVDEVREMVSWVFSLEPAGLVRVFPGFVNDIPIPAADATTPGYYKLEAGYLDRGAGAIPALNASTTIFLRSRMTEAESADAIHGPQNLASGNASGGHFLGAIDHGHTVMFRDIPMGQVRRLILRVASAGAGGEIEIRMDGPDGQLLATTEVEVNGQWEQFYERSVELPEIEGRHQLYLRFVHPQQAGGLMNLDSVTFVR